MQSNKYTFLFTFCFCLFVLFTSCTKEADSIEVTAIEISPEDFLETYVHQDILFQFSYTNPTTGIANGWLIDKKGEVRTYDLSTQSNPSSIADRGNCNKTDLLSLYAHSTPNGVVIEAEELVAKYRQIRDAANGILSSNQKGSEKEGTSSFYAIAKNSNNLTTYAGCGGGCINDSNRDTVYPYARIVLDQSGTDNRQNQNTAATELTEWLSSIHETVWQ